MAARRGSQREVVLLVHGIWMRGELMGLLANQLERQGYRTETISYPFLAHSPAENATLVRDAIDRINAPVVHLVGYSLGGIVLLHALQRFTSLPPGKVVLIGSPVNGSRVARALHAHSLLRPLLGRSVEEGLLGGAPRFRAQRPLGIIYGTRRLGIAALLFGDDEAGDGVVSTRETAIEGVTDAISVPYSHSMMVFSRHCASLVARFLASSRFSDARVERPPEALSAGDDRHN